MNLPIQCPMCNTNLVNIKFVWKCLNRKCKHYNKRQFGQKAEEE